MHQGPEKAGGTQGQEALHSTETANFPHTMKKAAILLMTAVLMASTMGDALAQFGQRRGNEGGRGGYPDRQQPDRRQEGRQPPQQPGGGQDSRMSPEERQRLRDQIRQHGYPDRQKRQ